MNFDIENDFEIVLFLWLISYDSFMTSYTYQVHMDHYIELVDYCCEQSGWSCNVPNRANIYLDVDVHSMRYDSYDEPSDTVLYWVDHHLVEE